MFLVCYEQDPVDQSWSLCVSAMTVVFLLHQFNVNTSSHAARVLVSTGVQFRTVMCQCTVLLAKHQHPTVLPYHPQTSPPGQDEYHNYIPCILQLLHQPYARAAVMKGGIIWRLTMDILSRHETLQEVLLGLIEGGPTGDIGYQCSVTLLEGNWQEVDNCLSQDELDTISGDYKVYTGKIS